MGYAALSLAKLIAGEYMEGIASAGKEFE